jgi:plastocyanin
MRLSRLIWFAPAALLACSDTNYGSGNNPACSPTATQVCASAAAFNPVNLTITAGTTVTWKDGSGIAHTVTNDPGAAQTFDLSLAGNSSVSRQFTTAGTFTYHCQFHGAPGNGMHGTITVNP